MAWLDQHEETDLPFVAEKTGAPAAVMASLGTLRDYLDGRARVEQALEALRHIEYVYGRPVQTAVRNFSQCLYLETEERNIEAAQESLGSMISWVLRERF